MYLRGGGGRFSAVAAAAIHVVSHALFKYYKKARGARWQWRKRVKVASPPSEDGEAPRAPPLSLSLFLFPLPPPLLQFNPPSPPSPSASASSASASASAGDQEAPLRQLFHLSQSQLRFLPLSPFFCYEVPLPLCGGKTGIEEEEEEDQEPVEEGDGPTSGNKRRIRHIQNKVTGGTKREENRPRTKSRKGRGKGNPLLVAPQFEKQTEECFFACQNQIRP